ncbi:MAG: dihydropteroate synthase [Actinobacteria bacterium]|nr:dihydropteroate synthase [Actinomycetota bacterium]
MESPSGSPAGRKSSQGSGSRPWTVMGILNVTPDSFHDGGRYLNYVLAVTRAREMAAAGAGIIDVGGESTRPGAQPVAAEEELKRVTPVIEALSADPGIPISIDTSKASVARAALEAGATMINDVTALRGDPEMATVAAAAACPICLMHMQGEPRTMQENPQYDDVVADIIQFFKERVDFAVSRGIKRENIILDPGIGFGKTLGHNLEILRRLDELGALGLPLLIGVSRKRFIGMIMNDEETGQRLPGTIAANLMAFERGASIFRVHDVAENFQALKVAAAIAG